MAIEQKIKILAVSTGFNTRKHYFIDTALAKCLSFPDYVRGELRANLTSCKTDCAVRTARVAAVLNFDICAASRSI